MSRRLANGVTVLFISAVLVAGSAGATTSTKFAAKRYLADVAPVNHALGIFVKDAKLWGNSTTQETVTKQTQPVISALKKLQNDLISQNWPAKSRRDIRKLIGTPRVPVGNVML